MASADEMRSRVEAELLSTEETYVREMTTLIEVFIIPLRTFLLEAKQRNQQGDSTGIDSLLSQDLVTTLFSNLEQLIDFNRQLLADLRKVGHETEESMAEVIAKTAPFLKMYSLYINNFDRANEKLEQILHNPTMAAFIRACELQTACHGLTLRAFLIQPVQRIPRYKLLLAEMLKHTPEDRPDHNKLNEALKNISKVATTINDAVTQQEQRMKVIELQEAFGESLTTPSRFFVKEGPLIKVCRNGRKKFHFVVFNDLLLYGTEKLTMGKKQYRLHRKIELSSCVLVDFGLSDMSFMVLNEDKSFVCMAANVDDRQRWFSAIGDQIQRLYLMGSIRKADHPLNNLQSVTVWVLENNKPVRATYDITAPLECAQGVINIAQFNRRTSGKMTEDPNASGKWGFRRSTVDDSDDEEEMSYGERDEDALQTIPEEPGTASVQRRKSGEFQGLLGSFYKGLSNSKRNLGNDRPMSPVPQSAGPNAHEVVCNIVMGDHGVGFQVQDTESGPSVVGFREMEGNNPARDGGIQLHDVILKLGNKSTRNLKDVNKELKHIKPNEQFTITVMREYEEVEDLPDTPGSTPTSTQRPKLSAAAQLTIGELAKSPRFINRQEGDQEGTDTERNSESTRSVPLVAPRPARPPPPPPGANRSSESMRPLSGPPTSPGRPMSAVGSPNLAMLAAAAANHRNSQRADAFASQLKVGQPNGDDGLGTPGDRLSIPSRPPSLPNSQPPSRTGSPVSVRPISEETEPVVTVGIHKLPALPPLPNKARPPPVPGSAAPPPPSVPPPVPPAVAAGGSPSTSSEERPESNGADEPVDDALQATGIAAGLPSSRPLRPAARRGPGMSRAQTLRPELLASAAAAAPAGDRQSMSAIDSGVDNTGAQPSIVPFVYNAKNPPPTISLAELQDESIDLTARGIDTSRKEMYLPDEDFEALFGMDKQKFLALPAWRQKNLKKTHNLF